jgi:hypothetical protein
MLGDDSCLRCGIRCAVVMWTRLDSLRLAMLTALSILLRLTIDLNRFQITDYGLLPSFYTASPRQRLFHDWDGCFSLTFLRLTGLRIRHAG